MPSACGQFGGHLEVQHVAGVVLDDVQHARAAVDRLGGGQHLVGHRRGEDRAGAGRIEHAHAHKAAVHRLVAAAAAADNAHFALARRVFADHDAVLVIHPNQVAMRLLHATQRLFDDVVHIIDQFLHRVTPF